MSLKGFPSGDIVVSTPQIGLVNQQLSTCVPVTDAKGGPVRSIKSTVNSFVTNQYDIPDTDFVETGTRFTVDLYHYGETLTDKNATDWSRASGMSEKSAMR